MEAKGGEVRRVHIIYFLSHKGRIEHPHLIRLHHFNRNGVYLRDVKRWLADLRGKEMPEAFTWSYKRRYKAGYVWQDLLDDDLLTPLSDNEYVLKGSEIIPTPFDPPPSYCEKKASISKKQQPIEVEIRGEGETEEFKRQEQASSEEAFQRELDSKINTSTEFSSEINEESPLFGSDRSTLTNDSMKLEQDHQKHEKFQNSSFVSTLLSKKHKKKSNKGKAEKGGTLASSYSSSSSSSWCSQSDQFTKSKSYSSGASSMLRNLIPCGAVDTNDTVYVVMNRADIDNTKSSSKHQNKAEAEICKEDKLGGSARVLGTTWNQQQQEQQHQCPRQSCDGGQGSKKKKKQGESTKQKTAFAAYKPTAGPICSQCGKSFKPEKMHSHMKSCRGMKALAKTTTVSVEKMPAQESVTSSHEQSTYGYFLAN